MILPWLNSPTSGYFLKTYDHSKWPWESNVSKNHCFRPSFAVLLYYLNWFVRKNWKSVDNFFTKPTLFGFLKRNKFKWTPEIDFLDNFAFVKPFFTHIGRISSDWECFVTSNSKLLCFEMERKDVCLTSTVDTKISVWSREPRLLGPIPIDP